MGFCPLKWEEKKTVGKTIVFIRNFRIVSTNYTRDAQDRNSIEKIEGGGNSSNNKMSRQFSHRFQSTIRAHTEKIKRTSSFSKRSLVSSWMWGEEKKNCYCYDFLPPDTLSTAAYYCESIVCRRSVDTSRVRAHDGRPTTFGPPAVNNTPPSYYLFIFIAYARVAMTVRATSFGGGGGGGGRLRYAAAAAVAVVYGCCTPRNVNTTPRGRARIL